MSGYYGWAPYTGFMVKTKQLKWNSEVVILECDWFDLKTQRSGRREGDRYQINLEEGELEQIQERLLICLKKGPLILWVPYGAGAFQYMPFSNWKNVKQEAQNQYTAIVPWFTHCIVVGGYENNRFRIYDCSHRNGIFLVSKDQLLINVLAMNLNPAVEKLAFLEGFAFHCCFYSE